MPISPARPDNKLVSAIVKATLPFTGSGPERWASWGVAFVEAHMAAPGGLSLDIGAHIGGSALLFGALLEAMYGEHAAPPLWSVDPFGSKPYDKGVPAYGAETYLAFKHNVREMEYHAHWLMASHEFLTRMHGVELWRPGSKLEAAIDTRTGMPITLPVGEPVHAGEQLKVTFALVDGEHTADSILADLLALERWTAPRSTIVVDNIDDDPRTAQALTEYVEDLPSHTMYFRQASSDAQVGGGWAIITRSEK